MQVKDLEVDSMAELKPTTPQATANYYGGTGVHGPYCRQTAIKLVLYSGLYGRQRRNTPGPCME